MAAVLRRLSIVAVVAVLAAGFVLYLLARPFQRIDELDARYARVGRGMSRAQVEAIMGGPGEPWAGPYTALWDDDPLPEGEDRRIAAAARYSVRTFYLPVTFEFTYDRDGLLVGRYRYD